MYGFLNFFDTVYSRSLITASIAKTKKKLKTLVFENIFFSFQRTNF